MPLFATEEEWARLAGDASAVADKADAYIRDILRQLDTVKATSDASAITAEQTCSLIEQKFITLSADFADLQRENSSLSAAVERRAAEISELHAEKSRLSVTAVEKDGGMEKLSVEFSELERSKRQLLHLLEQRDAEIAEKNALLKTYFDKIVNLTDEVALKEAKACDFQAEVARSRAENARLLQEKELIEKHNAWLNEEMTSKLDNLVELRRSYSEYEIDMSAKLADTERQLNDIVHSSNLHKERAQELELKLTSLREEFRVFKEEATVKEERLSIELSIVSKLAELYKESTKEWSRKAGNLEGAIKSLEEHLNQLESDYKEKLAKEMAEKEDLRKEAADLKAKLELSQEENEKFKKSTESNLLSFPTFDGERAIARIVDSDKIEKDNSMLVPKVPSGASSTALAASLLRNGWSLAKMYEKYQEAVDAFGHERAGRKYSEAVLERVLMEVEEKAVVILEERVDHERMVEAYNLMDQKLQQSLSEHSKLENNIRMLKADLRRKERDYSIAQKEITDLEKQITILVKECQDIQVRYGGGGLKYIEEPVDRSFVGTTDESDVGKIISERLLSFKDINGLIEQNVQLRSLVRTLSDEKEQRDRELKDQFEIELQNFKNEAAEKVEAVLKRSEEQGHMIEALHSSVAMYKRLYEEGHKSPLGNPQPATNVSDGRKDLKLLIESSSEASKKALEAAVEKANLLEEQLAKSRDDAISFRLERDRLAIEAKYEHERFEDLKKEVEHQNEKWNSIGERNAQFCQLIIDHQKKLHEMSELLRASDESSHKLSMEVSRLMQERDIFIKSEERALDEVRNMSEQVHRLQASLNTIHSAEAARENSSAMENKEKEEHVKQIEREWAEAKKELQEERDRARTLILEKEEILKDALRRAEQFAKEKEDLLLIAHAAEARASVAEARCLEVEGKGKLSTSKIIAEKGSAEIIVDASDNVFEELQKARIEIGRMTEKAKSYEDHMLQYKQIAQTEETAVQQIESAYEQLRSEAEKMKKSQESEIFTLKERLSELESDIISKSAELSQAALDKQEALSSTLMEIAHLKEENARKVSQLAEQEVHISLLKEDLDKEHQRWQTSQKNYERQVILQSETIQELTKTSKELSALQNEVFELRKVVEIQKTENGTLKSMWQAEKAVLEKSRDEAQKAYKEIDEQNKILHNHLEALHIKLAEKERGNSQIFSGNSSKGSHEDTDIQVVISYLRRSKEIAETEISLLKQEKLRFQSQLESALKASERTQALLDAERSNARLTLFSEGEFKSLKLQVNELNLLRESNMQLREESKYNFEECQNLREIIQKMKTETEHLKTLLAEREIEIGACKKEIEMQDMERANLENTNLELLAKTKNLDVQVYERLKEDYQQLQIKLREKESEVEEARKLISSKHEVIAKLEHDLASTHSELMEKEKKLSSIEQSEAALRVDSEKQRKFYKKKVEVFIKEKENLVKEKESIIKQTEELSTEKQILLKQVEDLKREKQVLEFKSSKRSAGDASTDHVMKEKDAKIQVLEKLLEREKSKRQKNETATTVSLKSISQAGTLSASLLPSESSDESTKGYLLSLEKVDPLLPGVDSSLLPSTSAETSSLDASAIVSGPQVPIDRSSTQTLVPVAGLQQKPLEERAKRSLVTKPVVEMRKTGGRRLVRPRLEESPESAGDTEPTEMDGVNNPNEQEKPASTSDPEGLCGPASRKRLPSPAPEIRGVCVQVDNMSDVEQPSSKKLRVSETLVQGTETEGESVPISNLIDADNVNSDSVAGDMVQLSTGPVLAGKEEERDTLTEPMEELKEEQDIENKSTQNETPPDDAADEVEILLEKSTEAVDTSDLVAKEQDVVNSQNSLEVESDKEEGELMVDVIEQQGEETAVSMAENETTGTQGELDADGGVVNTSGTEGFSSEEKIESEEITEEISEASDEPKTGDGNENVGNSVLETSEPTLQIMNPGHETSARSASESSASKGKEEEKEVPGRRIVHIGERARENAALRQAGGINPTPARGRGRISASPRARGRARGRIVRTREGDKEHP